MALSAGGVEMAVGAVDDLGLGQHDAALGVEVVDDEGVLSRRARSWRAWRV